MDDIAQALPQFDAVLFKHMGFVLRNLGKAAGLGLSNARFVKTPGDKETQSYYRHITRLSVGLALTTDYAMLTLGGQLKRRERLSGRFADLLSNLYLCSAVLKHYQNQGSQTDDLPLLHWACQQTRYQAQQALVAILGLLPLRLGAWKLGLLIFPFGKPYAPPQDQLTHEVAQLLLHDSSCRDRLTQGIYINRQAGDATGRIERAFSAVLAAIPVEAKLKQAVKQGLLIKQVAELLREQALEKNLITQAEADLLVSAEQARLVAIRVDEFFPEALVA